ncbi:hypothetical protein PHYSODRAFT_429631, partial [Phytophthora sojae]
LCCVAAVLRHEPSADALQNLWSLISECLGPSAHLSLSEACTFDNLQLLVWIWDISSTTEETTGSGWTLTNYRRSNPHYYAYQFGQSLKAAINSNGCRMDFRPFFGLVELVAAKGILSVLQFFHDHDAGRSDLLE